MPFSSGGSCRNMSQAGAVLLPGSTGLPAPTKRLLTSTRPRTGSGWLGTEVDPAHKRQQLS